MSDWSKKYGGSKWVRVHDSGVVTHGSTEPVLTILELRNFELRDLFLIGINDSCGQIIVPTEQRVSEVRTALEPAYQVRVERMENGDWSADFVRRTLDGTTPSWFITDITLKDGKVVMRDGRWV